MKICYLLGIKCFEMSREEYDKMEPKDLIEEIYCKQCGGKLQYNKRIYEYDAFSGIAIEAEIYARCKLNPVSHGYPSWHPIKIV